MVETISGVDYEALDSETGEGLPSSPDDLRLVAACRRLGLDPEAVFYNRQEDSLAELGIAFDEKEAVTEGESERAKLISARNLVKTTSLNSAR
jgi:hypothetical protein